MAAGALRNPADDALEVTRTELGGRNAGGFRAGVALVVGGWRAARGEQHLTHLEDAVEEDAVHGRHERGRELARGRVEAHRVVERGRARFVAADS